MCISKQEHRLSAAVSACLAGILLLVPPAGERTAQAGVTAVVNGSRLEISSDQGFDTIQIAGGLADPIQIRGTLVKDVTRQGIDTIVIDAPGDAVTFGFPGGVFDFDGDIEVNLPKGGFCDLRLVVSGDLTIRAQTGRIILGELSNFVVVGGDFVVEGGPGPDHISSNDPFSALEMLVYGDLMIATGGGADSVAISRFSRVMGNTFIDLGQSTGGEQGDNSNAQDDKDRFETSAATLDGSLIVLGVTGDDVVLLGFATYIGGDVLMDLGAGADSVSLFGLTLAEGAMIQVDGGNGNSDVLWLGGFPLLSSAYAGFETVNP